jgi:hypothetical protein
MPDSARDALRSRLEQRRGQAARLERRDARVAAARLAVFAAGLAVAVGWWWRHALSPAWLLLPAGAFLTLVVAHDRVLRDLARARRAVAFCEDALARLGGKSPDGGQTGMGFVREDHPYAQDLDLFGPGSLFHLLCTTRTRPGEERLAAWLQAPADPAEVRARQRAVAELAPRLDLREALAVLGEDVRATVDAEGLARWGRAPPALRRTAGAAAALSAATSVAAAAAWALGAGPLPFLAAVLAAATLRRVLRAPLARVFASLDRPSAELAVLSLLLSRLEHERFIDPRLEQQQRRLGAGAAAASRRIGQLTSIAARIEWAHNQLFAPVAFLLQWTPLHAVAVERWRAACGADVGAWLDAVAELEALSALAGYAHARPHHVFPEVLDRHPGEPPLLEADELRHPLLPGAVPNPVRLGGDHGPAALLVSGSNMSGKSTYLRTVGVAAVLGLAGAPVAAARCRLTQLVPGATIRIQDSLQAGRSRFYAEITRLRALQDLARGPVPLLFLLDEILHGTNSHDRRIGAQAVLETFLRRGAIGLVTTHDLALTELSERERALANAHFEDHVVDGRVAFDFRLRPGVVGHSNALALMRAVGLEV